MSWIMFRMLMSAILTLVATGDGDGSAAPDRANSLAGKCVRGKMKGGGRECLTAHGNRMRIQRREFFTALVGAGAVWPVAARAAGGGARNWVSWFLVV
jgi:hypothetical protein